MVLKVFQVIYFATAILILPGCRQDAFNGDPTVITKFEISEGEILNDQGNYSFKPRSPSREVEVLLELQAPYEIRKKPDKTYKSFSNSFKLIVKNGESIVASGSDPFATVPIPSFPIPYPSGDPRNEELKRKIKLPTGCIRVKFIPSDQTDYQIVVKAAEGFKKYVLTVKQ